MQRLLIAALVAGFATAAYAQPDTTDAPPTGAHHGRVGMRLGGMGRQDVDANHDGKVTLDEVLASEGRGMIAHLDANHDGVIDRKEFKVLVDLATMKRGAAAGQRAERLFDVFDANHDGVITQAEREAVTKRQFERLDTNHDGWLSKEEIAAGKGQLQQLEN